MPVSEDATLVRRRRSVVGSGLRDWPLRSKGVLVIALPLLFVLADCGALIVLGTQQSRDHSASQRAFGVQRAAAVLLVLLLDAETGVRGFVSTRQSKFLTPYSRPGLICRRRWVR